MHIERDLDHGIYVALERTGTTLPIIIALAQKHGAYYHEDGQIWYRVKFPGENVSSFNANGLSLRLQQPLVAS